MMMDPKELPNNSDAFRQKQASEAETKKGVSNKKEKVVKGNVKTKKNNIKSFMNTFINEDAGDIKSYIFRDVVIPLVKDGISDVIDMILYGETRGRRRRRSSSSTSDRESYRGYYDSRSSRDRRSSDRDRNRGRFDCEELIYEYREDAEDVREKMLDAFEEYKVVTMLDMYEFSGKTPPYTAKNYGWMYLHEDDIRVVRAGRDGWMLKMKRPMPID